MRISLANSTRSFSAAEQQSLLDAALQAGLKLSHGCKSGNCGACRARLASGSVWYPNGPPLGLSAAEVADGQILLCQARAQSDLVLEPTEMRAAHDVAIKRLPCRLARAELLAHDVLGVHLRLPAVERLAFAAGQYVDVLLAGGGRRSFSIASAPHAARLIELHVRRVPGGEFTETLFARDPRGMLLWIEGPLGRFTYRNPESDPSAAAAARPKSPRKVLMVGGGTGVAPLQSMLAELIATGRDLATCRDLDGGSARDITLYWGVRAERDLYAMSQLRELADRAPGFRHHPVLSEPSAAWTGRRGWVHTAVLADLRSLAAHDIYAAGPPAMIAAVHREFLAHGADPARIFSEAFDYAPDSPARQRSKAATRS
jgi:CDP-4-dehydro-6-deoxyglucose reductase